MKDRSHTVQVASLRFAGLETVRISATRERKQSYGYKINGLENQVPSKMKGSLF